MYSASNMMAPPPWALLGIFSIHSYPSRSLTHTLVPKTPHILYPLHPNSSEPLTHTHNPQDSLLSLYNFHVFAAGEQCLDISTEGGVVSRPQTNPTSPGRAARPGPDREG